MKRAHRDEEHGRAAFTRGRFESKQGPGFGVALATLPGGVRSDLKRAHCDEGQGWAPSARGRFELKHGLGFGGMRKKLHW